MILALLLTTLFGALGLSLVLNATLEHLLAANYRDRTALHLAAESALETALHELGPYDDWHSALIGARPARFSDGVPSGSRTTATGRTVDLDRQTDLATCGTSPCRDADIVAQAAARPWGAANPRWRLFAWGPASSLAPAWEGDPYLLVWVADDPADEDGDPWRDAPPGTAGHGVVLLRAQALGPGGAHATVEALVRRRCAAGPPGACVEGIHVQSWRVVD